ncbi:MAG: hypothetical protein P8Z39_00335 [Gammaproteobacteria bacterium]|jgi:hypothetical protein
MNKTSKLSILAVLLSLATFPFAFAGPASHTGKTPSASVIKTSLDNAPKAVFLNPKFEFEPVFEGTDITHDFVVENKGKAPLIINNIRPD